MLLAALALMSLAHPARSAPIVRGGGDDTLRGDYLEARTCDVWVGACYANSETSEAGKQATMAWKITEGAWKGVDLKGMGAVLLIDAKSTLGDRFHSPLPVRNVLLLDEKASDAQLVALRDFVKTQAGELGGNVIEERLVPITLKTDCCKKNGCAKLAAGDLVKIETRCLVDDDKVCGHEDTYYPPLLELSEKHPAYTVEHTVKETLLLKSWSDPDSRSAFLGKFELTSPPAEKKVDESQILAR
jgi:hypothetical protein